MNELSDWVWDMQQRGLSANTIRQRVYLVRVWLGVEMDVALPARRTVRERKWLDIEQVQAVLSVIPKDDDGRRDFALIAALLVTGFRVGQVRTWKRSDILGSDRNILINNWAVPRVVFEALQAAFEPFGDTQFGNLPISFTVSDAPIFTASKRQRWMGKHGSVQSTRNSEKQPLSLQEINRRIGRYASLAGLEPEGITAECLRRTYKMLGQHTVIALVQESLTNRNQRPVRWKRVEQDPRLHGVGRRSR
jgi:integrase